MKRIVLGVSIFVTAFILSDTFAYDKTVCDQIEHYKNASNVDFVIYQPNNSTTIESLKSVYELNDQSILESSNLQDPKNISLSACLILPKQKGIIKIANLYEPVDYLLASFGVSQSEFLENNQALSNKFENKPTVVFLPIIPTTEIKRKYVFPIIGARVTKKFMEEEITLINQAKSQYRGIELLGKKYNTNVLAIDDGTVVFAGYTEESFKQSEHIFTGHTVIIQHNNNIKAYYGFSATKIVVKTGDKIIKGGIIAKYGSDGHNHTLRLIVQKANKLVDPMSLFLQ